MAGNKLGGKKAAQTIKDRYGDDFYSQIGAKGGSKPTDKPKGFAAMTPERRRELGIKGGNASRWEVARHVKTQQ